MYQHLQIPDGAPIKLKPAGNKGWGMFATRDIARNECILEEKPLFKYSVSDLAHKPEPADDQLVEAVQKLPYDDQRRFLSLWHNSSMRITSIEGLFWKHHFMRGGTDSINAAVLLLMSCFNHSCVPNAFMPDLGEVEGAEQDASYMYAAVDIPASIEITFAYGESLHYFPRAYRQNILPRYSSASARPVARETTINWLATFGELCYGGSNRWLITEPPVTTLCRSATRRRSPLFQIRNSERTQNTMKSPTRYISFVLR